MSNFSNIMITFYEPHLIVESARAWLGTPWQHNQRCLGVGVDCVNFVLAVADAIGYQHANLDNYYRLATDDSLALGLAQFGLIKTHEDVSKVSAGEILIFATSNHGAPQHVGIATNIGLIHASQRTGVVEHSFSHPYTKLFRAAYTIPKNSY